MVNRRWSIGEWARLGDGARSVFEDEDDFESGSGTRVLAIGHERRAPGRWR
jgi:hypothetical protein